MEGGKRKVGDFVGRMCREEKTPGTKEENWAIC